MNRPSVKRAMKREHEREVMVHIWPKDGASIGERITVSIGDYLLALPPEKAIDLVLSLLEGEDITQPEAIDLFRGLR